MRDSPGVAERETRCAPIGLIRAENRLIYEEMKDGRLRGPGEHGAGGPPPPLGTAARAEEKHMFRSREITNAEALAPLRSVLH